MKVVNPDMPEPYKYETDYRNIPRQYLNPRIPQGRGAVKWQPFKTISEQYKRIDEFVENQNKIEMPVLSEDQLNILNDKITYIMHKNISCILSYWHNGYIQNIEGFITRINILENYIAIKSHNNNDIKTPLHYIVNIDF
ncbi:YolD-like family protein [Staphylococcus aureus]|uniref:YolD-like family protein n=1 Tax=Staphylococcus aureus TaxID=1280 RepID=UPI001BFE6CB6|nr:YolD-like family protein [Staphylococcus aureus]